jgi:hypothetical protein
MKERNENISNEKIDLKKDKKNKRKELRGSIISNITLSSKSKTLLIFRMIIISLICIFFPMETIIEKKLESFEKKIILPKINNLIKGTFFQNDYFKLFCNYCFQIFGGDDSMIIYISIVYFLFHPFIALKLVLITYLIYYGIIISQILFQSNRPFWESISDFHFCYTNYANPSENYFFVSFFFLYLIISYRLVDHKVKLELKYKIIINIGYFIILILYAINSLINQILYIYQLTFTLCISLILICIMIDLDTIIHNFTFKSLKNIYRSRQYKIKIFFFILGLTIFSSIMLFFIEEKNLNYIKNNLEKKGKCSLFDLNNLGIKNSFFEIADIFIIIGAFWGASFTVEKNIDKWWNDNLLYSLLKVLCAICVNLFFIFFNFYLTSLSFEILFIIECIIYFIRSYIIFGILPYIFNSFRKNKNKQNEINLFKTSIFSDENNKQNDYIIIDYNEQFINEKEKNNNEDEDNKKKKNKNKRSTLVDNVEIHVNHDGIKFTIKEDENNEDILNQDDSLYLYKEEELNEN